MAAARELRDRWLEHVNEGKTLIEEAGKYAVSKILPANVGYALPAPARPALLLPAA
jgi:hypothetical protein